MPIVKGSFKVLMKILPRNMRGVCVYVCVCERERARARERERERERERQRERERETVRKGKRIPWPFGGGRP